MQVELRKHEFGFKLSHDKEKLKSFILFFQEADDYKYQSALRNPRGRIDILLEDLAEYDTTGLVDRIESNAFTYEQLLYRIIDEIVFDDTGEDGFLESLATDDVFLYQRLSRLKEQGDKKAVDVFPGGLLRSYTVNLIPRIKIGNNSVTAIRQVKASDIGHLVTIRGIVTRVTQVKPAMRVATYICESCGTEIYQTVENDTFEALEECFSEKCVQRKIRGTLTLVTRGSRFEKWQGAQLQELTSDVPHGSVPRVLNIEFLGNLTGLVKPGEALTISGIFMPRPYYGLKRLKAGLLNDVYLYCTHVETRIIPISIPISTLSLISCFAPEIFGMERIKKILLLMLVGAPQMKREDGMKIRGDINVLLVGDPGIAKSQLLKTVSRISRRGVYTTGKGSSGVGLTASVIKDPTGELVLEGGALVLADGGVCCIDELDKMNEIDRTSIHEVMEQQSVSISKAGINTTLNARCAVLGAANPSRGRYDAKRSVMANIGLPLSLISRFDLICVLRDNADPSTDLALASHVTGLHLEGQQPEVDYEAMREYIESCKSVEPVLSSSIRPKLLEAYSRARQDRTTTPRHLLSLIRLTLANARLRKASVATEEDANEAISLMELMRVPTVQTRTVSRRKEIYDFLMGLSVSEEGRKVIELSNAFNGGSYSAKEIQEVIDEFKDGGIWVEEGGLLIITN